MRKNLKREQVGILQYYIKEWPLVCVRGQSRRD